MQLANVVAINFPWYVYIEVCILVLDIYEDVQYSGNSYCWSHGACAWPSIPKVGYWSNPPTKKTIADILHIFVGYTYVIHYVDTVPPDLHSEVFEKLRRLSGELYADMALIPKCFFKYSFFRKVFTLPEEEMVYKSAQNLIAVANWMNVNHENKLEHIIRNIQTACDNLGLYIDPANRIPNEDLKVWRLPQASWYLPIISDNSLIKEKKKRLAFVRAQNSQVMNVRIGLIAVTHRFSC